MDLSEFFSVYQRFPSPPMKTGTDFKDDNSLMTLSQSKVSNVKNKWLQVLFPSEDKIKTYLFQDQQDNNENSDCDQSTNSSKSVNLNVDRLYFKTNYRFGPKQPEFDYLNTYDMASSSMYSDIINCLVSYLVNCYNLSLSAIDPNYYEDTATYYQYYEDYQALQPKQRFTYNDYVKLRENTSLLVRLGYKMTLKLNTDNEVQETWNPNVAQKILSADFSQLSLVKDLYQQEKPLDQLECFLLSEVVKAFQDTEPNEWPEFSLKVKTNPSPVKFVSICKKLKSFRKICNHDKILLLSNAFYEIFSEKMVFDYNQTTDEWINPEYGTRFGRRDLFIWNRLLHDQVIPVIEALPDRWRNDEVVKALISVIIIFNPDLIGLLSADSVRHEQYVYIHLLKRYLESVCESPCEASDNLYRLLVGVEKFRELSKIVCKSMNEFDTGFHRSLRNLIIDVTNNKCE